MAATPPRWRSSSAPGSIMSRARRTGCRLPVWLPPRPPLAESAERLAADQVTLRHAPTAGATRRRGLFRLVGELARASQDFAGFGLSRRGRQVAPGARSGADQAGGETMNKKSIAPRARVLYPAPSSQQIITEAKRFGLLRIIWRRLVPNLHTIKRGLMHLTLFWRRLTILAGEIRTQVMVEIERNPLAVRQGAATIMCLA